MTRALGLVSLLWVWGVPDDTGAAMTPAPVVEDAPEAIGGLVLRGDAVARAELARDLRLRIPHVPLADFPADEGLTLYVIVTGAPGRYRIDAIVSDGRAYQRRVDVDADLASRAIASELAILVQGIEEGTVKPTREGRPGPRGRRPGPGPGARPTP